jgi:hypothetical protein
MPLTEYFFSSSCHQEKDFVYSQFSSKDLIFTSQETYNEQAIKLQWNNLKISVILGSDVYSTRFTAVMLNMHKYTVCFGMNY